MTTVIEAKHRYLHTLGSKTETLTESLELVLSVNTCMSHLWVKTASHEQSPVLFKYKTSVLNGGYRFKSVIFCIIYFYCAFYILLNEL